ncbi:phenoloxidase-activating factor 2-like [Diorhabda sublineata]|uniref:phenoloxidase-activating factor 2-like n=1 Tax=Diorhabda sublineata TaxID=1163346 RepID=UPI0024E0B244|nr:phenoloxidase-activating factor 2-like [Diorhabda sublineata]
MIPSTTNYLLLFSFMIIFEIEADDDKKGLKIGCGYRNKYGAGHQLSGARDGEAQFGEFPWMLALFEVDNRKREKYRCGASLIHPQVALTTAHCTETKISDNKFKVRAGAWDMELLVEILPYQDVEVDDVIIHPKYLPQALYNDIAILILKSPLELDEHVNTVCLPPQNFVAVDSGRGYSMGWGRIDKNSNETAVLLKKIDLPSIPRENCERMLRKTRFGPSYRMHESFLCAGGEKGKDTCRGDGGSPLVFPVGEDPDRYYQAGIVAWGIDCWEEHIPGVYVNVAKFRNWIDEQLTKRSFDVNTYRYQNMKLILTLLSLGLLVHGQEINEEERKILQQIFTSTETNNNDFNMPGFEEVPQTKTESYGAFEKCGEGKTRGIKRCVQYHECDGKTNTIVQSGVTDGFGIIDIRFGGNRECEHTLDVCCKISVGNVNNNDSDIDNGNENNGTNNTNDIDNGDNNTQTTPIVDQPSFCGIRNPNGIDFKITGNTNEAEYGEFPWAVAILNYQAVSQNDNSPLVCGGSLITPNVVLTGAHCVYKYKIYDLIVRAGEWDTQTEKERLPYQERSVRKVISHPDFNPGNLYNDFALLVLNDPIKKAKNVGTICLPPQGTVINEKKCYVSGWGKTVFGKVGVRQAILKKIELPTIERRKCQDTLRTTRLGSKFELHGSFICAGGEQGKDACTGDGGSPLVCPDPSNPERYVQAGIVAWGIGCGTLNIPGVYADVAKSRSWIDQELRRLNISDDAYTK